ncbi:MAG: hypothetical protein M1820_007639 [Bogoriella megaspora]|nr:MAG: hypothetical protein M1820_007639 [Bogoriella megaspora]
MFLVQSLKTGVPGSSHTISSTVDASTVSSRTFGLRFVSCGTLEYNSSGDPVFVSYFTDMRPGSITLGHKSMVIGFHTDIEVDVGTEKRAQHFIIPYHSIEYVYTGTHKERAITLSLRFAPRFYGTNRDLIQTLAELSAVPRDSLTRNQKFDHRRLPSIDTVHAMIAGKCTVYRLQLSDIEAISRIIRVFKEDPAPPPYFPWEPRATVSTEPFSSQMNRLIDRLKLGSTGENLDFDIKYQIQRLAQNGFLPPETCRRLVPHIHDISKNYGVEKTVEALRKLARELPYPGPHTPASELSIGALGELIEGYAAAFVREGSLYDLAERYDHIVLVYRATITPAGTYISGPDVDLTNRVLRKYDQYTDYFMRVEFADEDGEQIKFERTASLETIYHGRFKEVLKKGIAVAGRAYSFIGYSHSSLRNQSAWFMAPFVDSSTKELMLPSMVIANLGDFTKFRSPARCAARIGQAFSDTTSAIHLGRNGFKEIEDVERFETVHIDGVLYHLVRCFSDGCGTISWDLLRRIWREHKLTRALKPTVYQIRFAGAKGMASLDTRLKGEVLNLRHSMIKFESKEDWNFEICGEASRPLTCFLNKPLIKIMEDLGVPVESFLDLQTERINELRMVMRNPINAKFFLEENHIGRSTQIPLLIEMLQDIGLSFQNDEFLTNFVEMGSLFLLREMKYRGRYRLNKTQGITLYGIMDETGYLEEGEIYVPIERREGRQELTGGRVAITKSPVMHPGDIQIVRPVEVPQDSPLIALHNCVVFSSKGKRDLASQLSGGDLDGDQFHLIWDPKLLPMETLAPANYPKVPPVELNRPVQMDDMTDFFIHFIENDRLGQISSIHMQLADQRPGGTCDMDCIKLAGLASTAVDFSKTGVSANMESLPKYSRCRPDFMAPGPRVKIDNRAELNELDTEDEEFDKALLGAETGQIIYYESQKVLGKLYRNIDEGKFLKAIRDDAHGISTAHPGKDLMQRLQAYIRKNGAGMQWQHLSSLAREIKDAYEENLITMMHEYSTMAFKPLTEIEVVTGIIFGGNEGAQPKRTRELNNEMKDQFDREVEFMIRRITHSDDEEEASREDSLALAIACFTIAEEHRVARRIGELKSFRYIAAAVCLKEFKKIFPLGVLPMV